MAINKVDNTTQEQNYTFLPNQSSILHTVNTNKITVKGVNVIVDKPKRGDIMCVTNRKVVWIDGLSIDPQQLPAEYTPIGICLLIKGNKALVCYKDKINVSWAQGNRWDLEKMNNPSSEFFTDKNTGVDITVKCKLSNDNYYTASINFRKNSTRSYFVSTLNNILASNTNNQYFVHFLGEDSEKPAQNTSDSTFVRIYNEGTEQEITETYFYNRIVITGLFGGYSHNDIKIYYTTSDGQVKSIIGNSDDPSAESADMSMCQTVLYMTGYRNRVKNYSYENNQNSFLNWESGCCRSKFYDWVQANSTAPNDEMTSIGNVPGGQWNGKCPVTRTNFNNNIRCAILRENFANYDEYLDSMMIKVPDRQNHYFWVNVVSCFPSGKENTYKLAFSNYSPNISEGLFRWADWAAGISVNSPGLTAGNWWVPSVAEVSEIMRDITYGTNSWSSNPDIVNRVISKMRLEGTPNASNNEEVWPHLSGSAHWWTSCTYDNQKLAYVYDNNYGVMGNSNIYAMRNFMAITLYDYTK